VGGAAGQPEGGAGHQREGKSSNSIHRVTPPGFLDREA
jgi:hypothetical protein